MEKANFLSNLNKVQIEAVTHDQGPMLIVAGAGTGKTTVLIKRLCWLIQEKKVHPEQILLTTFGKKGAAELEERADKALPYGYVNLWINTFDAFADRILRDHALDIGLTPAFKILETTEQWMFIRKHLSEFKFDYWSPLGDPIKFIHEIVKHFSSLKNEDISSEDYLNYAESLKTNSDKVLSSDDDADELDSIKINELANGYHLYNRLLIKEGFLDFGDLVRYTLKLFQERPNILKKYREQFKYIMVDEFQDTNTIQYKLIKLLAEPNNNLVAVGDDDQSIYRFRGASLSNIMQFKDDFPKAKKTVLIENYRSGQIILDHAYKFITHNNPNRLEPKLKINKKLVSKIKNKSTAHFYNFGSEYEETKIVVDMVRELHDKGVIWSEIAILIRANAMADKFVKELSRQNIPNYFVSLKGLYYKPIILDALEYLKLLDDYHESSALYRVLSLPTFRVEHKDFLILTKWARKKLWSLFETLQNNDAIRDLSDESRKNINKLLNLLKKHANLAKTDKASKVFIEIVRDCLIEYLDQDKDHISFAYLGQFHAKIKSFEESDDHGTLKDFLILIALEMEAGETGGLKFNFDDADTVKVMTAHSAKGKEFEHVFIVDLVDRKFPTTNRGDKIQIPEELGVIKDQGKDAHIEEERRLFYVAMTRAKYGLYCTGARDYGGLRDKKPSRFINEAELEIITSKSAVKNEFENELKKIDSTPPRVQYPLPKIFSFSQLKNYQNCPLNYKFIYILNIPIEASPNGTLGICIHNCLRCFFLPIIKDPYQTSLFPKEKVDEKLLSLNQLLKYYKEFWSNNGFKDKKQADGFKESGKKMLKQFHKKNESSHPNILFLEKKFKISLDESNQYILTGTIDRVDLLADGSVEIIDYKTGETQIEENPSYKKQRQLLLYQIAVEEILKKEVSKLSYYNLFANKKITFTAKRNDIEKVKKEMIGLIEKIRSGDFEPIKRTDHKYCKHGPISD